jgi:tetratricopeptide (TPR) repeat protein
VAAINKRKLLESAQRNLQKGAVDKALKDYQAVLEADPRDTNVRLKVGDLLQKAGRNDEAIAAYLKVADQFQRDGFDAKAVALYKQVTKIDAKRTDVYVPLADLYQRLGLLSEAMGALQTAAESCQRDGRKREALELLRRMANLDPANVTSRLKVAELLQQERLLDEAVAEFREAAAELHRQGDWEARAGVLERIVELRPACVEELEALAATWLERGEPRRAHAFAQKLVEADPARPESQELLAHVLVGLGQNELAIDAFRECAEAWRMRGEEGKAREIVQRYLPTQDFAALTDASATPEARMAGGTAAATELFGGVGDLGAEPAAGEGVFGSEPIEIGGGGVVELGGDAPAFAGDESVRPPAPAAAAPAPPPVVAPLAPPRREATPAPAPPEGDVEQLLAEAAVYCRYGKHERALACLESALAREPEHGGALEQLGEVHAAAGAPERAVEAWSRAASLAAAAGDAARFAALRERVEAIDPLAAAGLDGPTPSSVDEAALFEAADDEAGADGGDGGAAGATLDEDIEIDVDDLALDGVEPAPEGAVAEAAPGAEGEFDLELDEDLAVAAGGAAEAVPDAGVAGPERERDRGVAQRAALLPSPAADECLAAEQPRADESPPADRDEPPTDGALAARDEEPPPTREQAWELPEGDEFATTAPPEPLAADAPPEATDAARSSRAGAPGELSMSAAQQIQEDFEEAGFYFDQGLLGEAEAVYRRILARAPGHPGALLRLGEIAVQRGGSPSVVAELAPASALGAAPSPAAAAPAVAREEAPEIEPPDALDLTAPTLDASDAWPGEDAAPDQADDPTADVVAAPPVEIVDDSTLRPAPAPAPARADDTDLTTPDVAPPDDASGAAFDLAAELSEALADTGSRPASGAATDEDGFASLFRDFKRGVSQTLGEGDVETHFDLGIAYREMGLFEDAIGEFRYALGSPSRRVDALQMMGLCAIDLGRGQDAVGHLEQALASPEVPGEREAPLRYELGRAYQVLGDRVRALDAFRRVRELAPDYQDVAERIAALASGADAPEPAGAPESPDEAFESFDDVVAAAAADPAPDAPRYETFDDLLAEANDEHDATQGGDAERAVAPAREQNDAGSRVAAGGVAHGGGADAALEAETEAAFVEATVDDDDTAAGEEPLPPAQASAPVPEPQPEPAETPAPAQRRRRKVSFF